jgi:hypothetical protein
MGKSRRKKEYPDYAAPLPGQAEAFVKTAKLLEQMSSPSSKRFCHFPRDGHVEIHYDGEWVMRVTMEGIKFNHDHPDFKRADEFDKLVIKIMEETYPWLSRKDWISVGDRLPQSGDNILAAWTANGYHQHMTYDGGEWVEAIPGRELTIVDGVTHWFPFPGVP